VAGGGGLFPFLDIAAAAAAAPLSRRAASEFHLRMIDS